MAISEKILNRMRCSPFSIGDSVRPLEPNDIETVIVDSENGFVSCGSFVKLKSQSKETGEVSISELQAGDTFPKIYGFVLSDSNSPKINGIRCVENNKAARVLRFSAKFTGAPGIISDLPEGQLPTKLRVITSSKDREKYPVGFIIFNNGIQNNTYTFTEIAGNLLLF